MRAMKLNLKNLYSDLSAEEIRYDYYILITECDMGTFQMESYGVAAVCPVTGEQAEVLDVTASVPRMDDLLDRLARNQVSPVHLRNVIDDWL